MRTQLGQENKTPDDLIGQFARDGYVILENALPAEFIESVRHEFMQVMEAKIKRFGLKRVQVTDGRNKENSNVQIDFKPEGGNHDLNRWNMHLPSTPTFINNQLIAQPSVIEVIEHFMGKEAVAFIIASDTPYPDSGFQNIHQDFPRFGITVNIPLVDFTEENAPLEVWPGTHTYHKDGKGAFYSDNVNLSKEEIREIAATVPSKRVLVKAGTIIIRDQRLVHRGTANCSQFPRPCLSIWYKNVDAFSLADLTIPIPHRGIADAFSKVALWQRNTGRGNGHAVKNRQLLNFGNFFGRVVEEFSGSDRDNRRPISKAVWQSLSPKAQLLLRYASVEGASVPAGSRSWLGSSTMAIIGSLFALYGLCLVRPTPSGSQKPALQPDTP
jgi:ectoine hydroxylase-related dioxygenase (phytanoyl-CoA dioxygenase family)